MFSIFERDLLRAGPIELVLQQTRRLSEGERMHWLAVSDVIFPEGGSLSMSGWLHRWYSEQHPDLGRRSVAVALRYLLELEVRNADRSFALLDLYPELSTGSKCPACPQRNTDSVEAVIMHLNDVHQWGRNRIADWVDTLPNPE
jgi:hypothetical protein